MEKSGSIRRNNYFKIPAKREPMEERFRDVLASVHLFGIEKHFYDLSQLTAPATPDWLRGATLYEIYVRAFSSEGTFAAVTKRLPLLKDLGIRLLWLMPIYPIGRLRRKGSLGCPYAVCDYFTVNPEYGTEEDFKALVQEAHRLGLKILIDMVLNHVAPDYQMHGNGGDIFLRDAKGNRQRRIADWSDVFDLDYQKRETRHHALQIMRHWIEKYDVDGFRCDVAGMVPLDFWEWAVPQLKTIKPQLFFLAEWESPLLHRLAFQAGYDWSLFELMKLVKKDLLPAYRLAEWIMLKKNTYPRNALFLRFLENHDKERAVKIFGQAMLPFLVFIFTIDGLPLLYNGQETGAGSYLNLFEKEEIDWGQKNESLRGMIKQLILLRRRQAALSSPEYDFDFFKGQADGLYMRRGRQKKIAVLLNFGGRKIELSERQQMKKSDILLNTDGRWDGKYLLPYQALIVKK